MDRKALENMLEQGQDNAMLRYTLGNLYLKEGDPETAVTHLRKALEFNSRHSASWKILGKALNLAGHNHEAVDAYQQGIAIAEELGDIQAAKEMRVFLNRLQRTD